MQVEYYAEDVPFIADVMSWAPLDHIIKKLEKGRISEECDEFMWCELSREELDELTGWLCNEANHNKKKRIAERIGEIADSFLVQLQLYK